MKPEPFDPTVPKDAMDAAHTAGSLAARQLRIAIAQLEGVDPELQRRFLSAHITVSQILHGMRGK